MVEPREIPFTKVKRVLMAISLLGVFVFGMAGAATIFWKEALLEQAEATIVAEVKKRSETYFDEHANSPAVAAVRRFANEETRRRIEEKLAAMRAGIPRIIAIIMTCSDPCEGASRSEIEAAVTASMEKRIKALELLRERITTKTESYIEETKELLIRDLRIVTISNAAAFLLIILLLLTPLQNLQGLIITAILAMVGSLWVTWLYVFNQDWLFTLIFQDFTGWAYTAYLGILLVTILDVVWNKARITRAIVDTISSALNVAIAPC